MLAMIVLASKLSPYEFGLVSITEVLLAIVTSLGTTGIREYLFACKDKDVDVMFQSAFWLNLILTIASIVLFLIVAPFWASYQGDARILNMSIICAAIFLFSQLQVIPKTWLEKTLQYPKQVKIQMPFIIIVHLAKIVAVLSGLGVYSLIVPSLIVQPVLTIFLYKGAGITPGLNMYRNRWQEMIRYIKYLVGANILIRITNESDKVIISKFVGLEALGVYSIAMQVANLITSPFIIISDNVLASVLPEYTEQKERFYQNYIAFVRAYVFVVFPIIGMMIVTATPIVETLYGTEWLAASVPLQVLLVYTAIKAATSSFDVIMNTFHLTPKVLRINMIYAPLHIVGVMLGGLWGLVGVSVSVALLRVVFANLQLQIISKILKSAFTKWYKDVMPYWLVVTIITGVFIWVYRLFEGQVNVYPLWIVIVVSALYTIVYYAIVRLLLKKELQKISGFLDLTVPKARRYFDKVFGL